MIPRLIVLSFFLFDFSLARLQFFDDEYLAAQFRVPQNNESLDLHENPDWSWYKLAPVNDNPVKAQRHWQEIRQALDFDAQKDDDLTGLFKGQDLYDVNLTFSFPFYGRLVNRVTLSSAFAILTGPEEDEVKLPSHISALMMPLPPSNTDIKFFDTGSKLVVQWIAHYLGDRVMLKVQATVHSSGTMVFVYQNVLPDLLNLAKVGSIIKQHEGKHDILIGLQDGWAREEEKGNGQYDAYAYPSVLVEPESLLGNWSMLTVYPDTGLCQLIEDRPDCSDRKDCLWCSGKCLSNFEKTRPESKCVKDCDWPCLEDAAYNPVCGSNGITYDNKCTMRQFACHTDTKMSVASQGVCPEANADTDCPKTCPARQDPVCGSTGRTFSNECMLKSYNCHRREGGGEEEALFVHQGECNPDYDYETGKRRGDDDDDDDDDDYVGERNEVKRKEEDDDDDCDHNCPKDMNPVCLNSFRQFNNKCQMNVAVCVERIQVETVQEGYCKGKQEEKEEKEDSREEDLVKIDCTGVGGGCSRELDPVCGSNLKTYSNECIFKQLVCQNNLDLTVKYQGKCGQPKLHLDGGSIRDDDDEGEDECDPKEAICSKMYEPLCGTDGKTYGNICEFQAAEKCDFEIKIDHDGACGEGKTAEEEEYKAHEHHTLSRILKGVVFLGTAIGISFMSVALYNMYRKSARPYPPQHPPPLHQGDTLGIPQNSNEQHHQYPPAAGGGAVSPLPSVPAQTVGPPRVELGGSRGGSASNTVRYDRLPLVPHIEDEVGHNNGNSQNS